MKPNRAIILAIIFSSLLVAGTILFSSPYQVLAQLQGPPADAGLVQCGRLGSGSNTAFCDLCDLMALVKNVLDYIWKGAWVLAAAMMIYGGFYMILPSFGAGGAGMYQKGQRILTNTAWGLVIIFFAWIMIDTVIKVVAAKSDLLSTSPGVIGGLGPWNKIQCKRAPERAAVALLEIPEEFKCKPGAQPIAGFDPCDPAVQRAMQAGDTVKNSSSPSGARRCSASTISNLNTNYGSTITTIAREEGVDPRLLGSILLIESNGTNITTVGPAGEVGIAQTLISSAKRVMGWDNLTDEEIAQRLRDPATSIRVGAKMLKAGITSTRTGGNMKYGIATYNAGLGALLPSNDCPGTIKIACSKNPGKLPMALDYADRVNECYTMMGGTSLF